MMGNGEAARPAEAPAGAPGTPRTIRARIAAQFGALAVVSLGWLTPLRGVCAPVFQCHSCPLSTFACPLGVIINFVSLRVWPLITIGILGLAASFGGRIWCGWACPFGLLQDGLRRLPVRKRELPRWTRGIKYAVLGVLVLGVPAVAPGSYWTFCGFCPAGTLESAIPWTIMGAASPLRWSFALRVGILLGVLALAVVVPRGFCRALCPLGAILAIGNRFSLLRMHPRAEGCTSCDRCARRCPMGMHPLDEMNGPECTRCGECLATGCIGLGAK